MFHTAETKGLLNIEHVITFSHFFGGQNRACASFSVLMLKNSRAHCYQESQRSSSRENSHFPFFLVVQMHMFEDHFCLFWASPTKWVLGCRK